MNKALILLAAALLFAAPAVAADGALLDVAAGKSFEEQRDKIMVDLADGETYAEISADDREKVATSLRRIQRVLGEKGSMSALHPDERVELVNEQERVNNILSQAGADSRMVCTREATVGTRLATRVCRTVAERRRLQDASRKALENAAAGRVNTRI